MTEYPRSPRNFNFSLPDARARWIAHAYDLKFEDVLNELHGQSGQIHGCPAIVTDEMFRASTAYYAYRFPQRMVRGLDPVRWATHPDNPDCGKCRVTLH